MSRKYILYSVLTLLMFLSAGYVLFDRYLFNIAQEPEEPEGNKSGEISHPLSIELLRRGEYLGSDIVIEQTLDAGANYNKYIASYRSEGLKIYALLTIPVMGKPEGGFPVVIFNHGYIPPAEYNTTERYTAYVDSFASNGYVVFKPDYRGHGNSEGEPQGAYYSPFYTIDVLNAVASVKKYESINPQKIGMWGHSMGGNIALRSLVVSKDIKAVVLWAGVVGTYDELMTKWKRIIPWSPENNQAGRHMLSIRENLIKDYGNPKENPSFWNLIDPRSFIIRA